MIRIEVSKSTFFIRVYEKGAKVHMKLLKNGPQTSEALFKFAGEASSPI